MKIGRILGVKKVLLGSCQIATGYLLVNMRIVNVETGQVYPIEKLPIITPIDSVLYLQTRICFEILTQFKVISRVEERKQIEIVTSSSTKSVKAYEYLNKGLALYNNGQFDDALQMYNIALGYDKKYGKAYYRRGLTNYALKYYEDAANDFDNSSNYLKKDTIYILMSNVYFKQGDLKKSYEYLKKAEKINPQSETIKAAIAIFPKDELNGNETIQKEETDKIDFQTIFEFNSGRAKVRRNKKYGFIDTLNNIIIPIVFDEISEFKNGLAGAKVGKRWGYIDGYGQLVIKPKYTEIESFNKWGLAAVMIKNKWGVINTKGATVVPIEFDRYYITGWDIDSLIIVTKTKNILGLSNVYGVYDITGRNIIPLIYDDIKIERAEYNFETHAYDYNPYNIYASLNGKWGVIDHNNKIIVPFKYQNKECIRGFKNGYSAVKVNERWGFVNSKGIEIIEPQYDNVNDCSSDYFEVKLEGNGY